MDPLPDLDDFVARVLWLTARIPRGALATYGQIAFLAGAPRAHRAAGSVLGSQLGPDASALPWHRVIRASGHIAFKGQLQRAQLQKQRLLAEGVSVSQGWKCDLGALEWSPSQSYWSTQWEEHRGEVL